jgi:signal transduction histidine kinase
VRRRLRRPPLSAWVGLAIVLAIALPAVGAAAAWWGVHAHQRAGVEHRVKAATALIVGEDGGADPPTPATMRGLARLGVEASLEPSKPTAFLKPGVVDPLLDGKSELDLKRRMVKETATAPAAFTTNGLAATLKGPDGKRALESRFEMFQIDDVLAHGTLFVPRPSTAARTAAAAGTALVLLLLVLAAGFVLLRRWVVQPLARLATDAEAIAGGSLAVRPVRSRTREVAQVGEALHGMADGLRGALAQRDLAEEQRRFLVTAIAHDLRTPLFTLRGSLEAIEHGIGEGDHLRRAQDKAKLLDGLVSDLFSFSRLEYAGPDLDRQVLDAAALAREAAAAVDDRIVVSAPGGMLAVEADHRALLRVLINLLDNAVRHARASVELAVRREPDGAVVFTVTDDGPGVDDVDLPHLFEPLFRADRTRNSRTGGAGLGLAIVDHLTAAQGATVHAENLVGGGARFTVRHPSTSLTCGEAAPV